MSVLSSSALIFLSQTDDEVFSIKNVFKIFSPPSKFAFAFYKFVALFIPDSCSSSPLSTTSLLIYRLLPDYCVLLPSLPLQLFYVKQGTHDQSDC